MPCTFMDGPAAGVGFTLSRAPMYLRLVQDAGGKWDCLNDLEDDPREGERVHVYEGVPGTHGKAFACGRGRGQHSGATEWWVYRHRADVDGEALRETAAWRAWASAQPAIGEAHPALALAREVRAGRARLEPARLHELAGGERDLYLHAMKEAGAIVRKLPNGLPGEPYDPCPECGWSPS